MGGSILPVTVHNNTIYFLFGKERDIDENPGWSDFGGGTEKGETFFSTAIREGSEELTGFLGSSEDIKKLLEKYGTYPIDFKTNGYATYRCYIFPMKYDDMLVHYYNNNQRFIQQKLDPSIIRDTKIFEKTEIRWFTFDDMQNMHKEFRSFYQKVVDLILQNKKPIEMFIKKKLHSTKRTKKTKKNKQKQRKPRQNKTKKY
jgi:8-oxo-dGTP pyrophosphatase MutT (NUDIX family)